MLRTARPALLAAALLSVPVALSAQTAPLRGGRVRPPANRSGPPVEVIDFEGFPAGTILSQVSGSNGSGPVAVRGYNPFLGPAANAALIFDSQFPTGGDFDLGTPHVYFGGPGIGPGGASGPYQNDRPLGKLLIIAENLVDWDGDGLVNSPDDLNAAATTGATLSLDFSAVGPVTVYGITVIDVEATEEPPTITYLDASGVELGSATLPATGDNGVAEVDLGSVSGVSAMVIHMRASGAVDELRFRTEGTGTLTFVPDLFATDLTPDGQTALVYDLFSPAGDFYFYDTVTDALDFKDSVGDSFVDFPTGISGTQRVSAIHGYPTQAGLWTEAGGWLDLGNVFPMGCGDDQGAGWDVSADGSTAVGSLWNGCAVQAFRWTAPGGLELLELLGDSPGSLPPNNRATKIADDGSLIGGFAQTLLVDRWPALWTPDGNGSLLPSGVYPVDAPGEVLAVSADGETVAGVWNLEGFRWSAATGVVPLGYLGGLPGGQTYPNAIAAGGQLIFGKTVPGFFDPATAFVWDAAHGMRSLAAIATAHGATIPAGLQLENVLAASTDGAVVLGQASDFFFNTYVFVLEMPVSAYGL